MDVLVAAARLLVDSGAAPQQRRPSETFAADAASEGYDRRKRPAAVALPPPDQDAAAGCASQSLTPPSTASGVGEGSSSMEGYPKGKAKASPPPLTSPTASVAHNSPEQPPQQPLQQAPPPPPPHQQPPQQPAYTFYYYHPNQQPQPQQDGATLLPLHIVPVPAGSAPAMGAWSAAMHASMQQQQQQLQQQQQQQTMPWQPAHGPTQPPALPLPPPPPHGMAMRPYMPTLPPLQQVLPAGAPVYQLADKRAWGCGGAPAGPSGSISSSMRQISTGTNTPPTTSSSSSSSSTAPSSRPPRHAAAAGPMVAPASTGAKAASLSAAAAEIEAVFPSLPAPGSTVGPAGADATGGAGRPSMRRLERVVSTSIPGTGVFVYVPPDAARPLLSPQEEEEKGERPEGWGRREPPTPSRRRRGAEAAGAGASSPEGDARRKRLQPQRQERGFTELDGEAQLVMSREAYAAIRAACDALVPGEGARLLDAVALETTGIYRRRYGQRPHPFGHPPVEEERTLYRNVGGMGYIIQTDDMPGGSQEVFPLTPPLASLAGGTFWLRKDKHTRKRRCSFADLARSQRARVIKTTYELIQAIGEEFSPGNMRLELLDRVFEHHTAKAGAAAFPPGGSTSSESRDSSSEDGGGAGTGTKRSAGPSEGAPRAADGAGATAAAPKRLRR